MADVPVLAVFLAGVAVISTLMSVQFAKKQST
jgi:hypothetical protein